jgi:hypothetical protein
VQLLQLGADIGHIRHCHLLRAAFRLQLVRSVELLFAIDNGFEHSVNLGNPFLVFEDHLLFLIVKLFILVCLLQ